MEDDAFALTREEIYAYIKIESRRGKKATEIFNALQEVDPTCAVAFSTICRWVKDFNNGRQESYKKPSSGRPVTVTDADNTEIVAQLLNSDRRFTCEEIAYETGISKSSVHVILTQNLGMRKIAARWVPHALSKTEKDKRVQICTELLNRYSEEGEMMLNRVVAIDETWIRSFEPELKRQSSEWHTPNSPRPVKYRRSMNCPKMLMIFAYDINGVLTTHRVPHGSTVNKEYYEWYLTKILRPAIRRKRPELLRLTPLILHDNATPHKSGVVRDVFERYHWEVLKHPPYSPDLSPPDYDLFPKLKEPLRGVRYDDLNELYVAVNAVVRDINKGCLATGVRDLPKRWESTIASAGDYIEGL